MTEDVTKKKPRRSAAQRILYLRAEAQRIEAQEKSREDAKNTRRKILLGEIVLRCLADLKDPDFSRLLLNHLRGEIPRLPHKRDVALFNDLLTISDVPSPAETTEVTPAAASAPAGAEAAETRNPVHGFDSNLSAATAEN